MRLTGAVQLAIEDLDERILLALVREALTEESMMFELFFNWRAIMAKLSELETRIAAISTKIDKAQTEILAAIGTLRAELADVDLPPGADAALTALDAKAQAMDEIIPDAPVPEPPVAA